MPPEDTACGLPTTSGGRGIYFADAEGKNFFRVTVDSDLSGKFRVDKYVRRHRVRHGGWAWTLRAAAEGLRRRRARYDAHRGPVALSILAFGLLAHRADVHERRPHERLGPPAHEREHARAGKAGGALRLPLDAIRASRSPRATMPRARRHDARRARARSSAIERLSARTTSPTGTSRRPARPRTPRRQPGVGWFSFPYTRTYTVEQFRRGPDDPRRWRRRPTASNSSPSPSARRAARSRAAPDDRSRVYLRFRDASPN